MVSGEEVGFAPGWPLMDGDPSWGEDYFLSGVNTPNDQITFVEIDGQEA